jgi:hypothetical protein
MRGENELHILRRCEPAHACEATLPQGYFAIPAWCSEPLAAEQACLEMGTAHKKTTSTLLSQRTISQQPRISLKNSIFKNKQVQNLAICQKNGKLYLAV